MTSENNQTVDSAEISEHYSQGKILDSIRAGIAAMDKTEESVTIDEMALVDEFHIGGRAATKELLDQINLTTDDMVFDIGCGLGGTSRFVASTYGCQVKGIDLTDEYAHTGAEISRWLGLSERVELRQGNALDTGFGEASFDAAIMLHVGMNIPDKDALFQEAGRVLRPNGQFAIYDIMRKSDAPLVYPVPWASSTSGCALASLEQYLSALEVAGFEISAIRDRSEYAGAFFNMLKKNAAAVDGPPPLGIHLLMGENTQEKVKNMVENVTLGKVAPIEIIARKL